MISAKSISPQNSATTARKLASQPLVSRRAVCAGLAGTLALPFIRRAKAGSLAELILFGPPASPSITLAYAVGAGLLGEVADKTSFKVWRTPDEMRAGLTSGQMQVVVMPITAAANLHARGLGVKLANVMTDGLLYVITTDASIRQMLARPSLIASPKVSSGERRSRPNWPHSGCRAPLPAPVWFWPAFLISACLCPSSASCISCSWAGWVSACSPSCRSQAFSTPASRLSLPHRPGLLFSSCLALSSCASRRNSSRGSRFRAVNTALRRYAGPFHWPSG